MNKNMMARLMTLADRLNGLHWKMGAAESCTGGGIAHAVTDVPGSSGWFSGGVVAYDNAIKQDVLSVAPEVLRAEGAVSEAVVTQMAQGALKLMSANIVVAVSGIAGPAGGSPDKPVGTVFFAWAWRDNSGTTQVSCHATLFEGTRDEVRHACVECALDGMIKICDLVQEHLTVPSALFAS